jgi:predicted amidophosphoribosyltransferase
MILAAKWGGGVECIPVLAGWLARACRIGLGAPPPLDAVVAVPRSRWRRLRHGRPLAEALAGALARELRRPLLPPPRRRGGPPQTSLDARARRSAPRGAFSVPSSLSEQLAGRTILLVDDVVTTGATLNACAEAIERAGARRVITAALTFSDPRRDRGR